MDYVLRLDVVLFANTLYIQTIRIKFHYLNEISVLFIVYIYYLYLIA